MKKIPAIDIHHFMENIKIANKDDDKDYFSYFSDAIDRAKDFAIGPFFWFIPNNYQLKIKWVSDNIGMHTPYSKDEWHGKEPAFFAEQLHPDDCDYVLSAFIFIYKTYADTKKINQENLVFNIYTRFLNKNKEHRWVVMQTAKIYMNELNQVESILCIIYDLSHLNIKNMPLLSLVDINNNHIRYFKSFKEEIESEYIDIPVITKREKEILQLMAQGDNTPIIAKKLFISYHTVQNHKRNLRKKTNTKTSSELIAYVIKYNILFIS
ncbi:helix-turn-helix transcriptional regulator [Elizabethkingia miricola]|uniref:Helix-turn-helix transcriptional regulator n=1 Tax=Elizabethkingia miricola TaxID=172045 RepID=A0AAQ1PLC8_ELIMR|nr:MULTISPECIES: LuxR C-terminal-related transcriptional regulator [Elizabethkingia]KUY20561.1 helix-turn-helix transcriptional regulator [Elizabethkingia miricola]MCL1653252.1 LuxR C-terminal-related transcriptional regulator [Elizabethkingia miricola]MCL1678045.1 LuxR C-terminal-related transcriptional regulator [Elizabethkingia miricola]OPC36758.1 helix-turn-helix transcriptional regulator [Elizabethkingia miricola]OPC70384.1 helix-turn-helix transcriptional regulator [Elizabethkingia miric